jgi:enoyl-CoA hydratase/carnithine racemase
MAYDYELLRARREGRAIWVTINAPPINVMTTALYEELQKLAAELEADADVTAVVLQSADPDFFIAHFDVSTILSFPIDREPRRSDRLNPFHEMCQRFRAMPKATICKINGRVGGGGSELAASCDMRFGVLGKTIVNQMEVPIGILPGGTGTQRLPRLMGRGRAMELILGGVDMDAATAERWGYLNRAFSSAEELDAYADGLARRIAAFPAPAVAAAKVAVLASESDPTPGLIEEAYLFQTVVGTPEAQAAMKRFLEIGGQTREGELRVGELNAEVSQRP